ncbi:hypothetical protein R1flu_018691 [Riccia fluitans]|uniref:Uncharacterized protein n=1 Tax=Riccia fluitans TaxID=41844 RepID=A0ABD1ZGJ8_9MARC
MQNSAGCKLNWLGRRRNSKTWKRKIKGKSSILRHKEQVITAYESLRTMVQVSFGDQMDEMELEELHLLKEFIKPNNKLKVGASDLMDHYDQIAMDIEAAKIDMKLVVADSAKQLVKLHEKLIEDHDTISKIKVGEESS